MKRKLLFVPLFAVLAAGGANADTAIGRILTIDQGNHVVTLRDGSAYDFRDSEFANWLSAFVPGDSVHIEWSQAGSMRRGEAIGSTSVFHDVGRVEAINAAARTVTLAGGRTYTFPDDEMTNIAMESFRPGDMVRIAYDVQQGRHVGRAIGGTASEEVTGVIESIDMGAGTVTLAGGAVYHVDATAKAGAILGGFRAGDQVALILQPNGAGRMIEHISPMAAM
jgi:Cu/Ag efflux protein CusF